MRRLVLLLCLFVSIAVQAQYRVTFRVAQLPSYHKKGDPVYLAGSFNNWKPNQKEAQLIADLNGNYSITLYPLSGQYEYKLTRGSWESVEAGEKGTAINNRVLAIKSDTTIEVSVLHWADHFPKKAKVSTASKNVHIVDTSFYIPQLLRYRRILIYLPESYNSSNQTYPVLYMQDGQNVFDEATSFSGEWGVDETLDTLGDRYGETIVVAIDNGGDKRMNEYNPFDMEQFGKGEGHHYVDFMVHTLMPYINRHYRTKRSSKNTAIAGSSMGGLISFYAMLKYPNKFGSAGIFSPAFWIAPKLKEYVEKHGKKVKGKIYFFAGKQEGEQMVPDMLGILEQMTRLSKADITTVIRSEGTHSEATWRNEFPLFYRWLAPYF
jgi:predicted alpha/beta superfamily hydrolase